MATNEHGEPTLTPFQNPNLVLLTLALKSHSHTHPSDSIFRGIGLFPCPLLGASQVGGATRREARALRGAPLFSFFLKKTTLSVDTFSQMSPFSHCISYASLTSCKIH